MSLATVAFLVVCMTAVSAVAGVEPLAAAAAETAAAGPPTVTGLAPDFGSTAGGAKVTIEGTGLRRADEVDFGGLKATGLVVSSNTKLFATAPAGGVGAVDVRVMTPSRTSAVTSADVFTYVDLTPGSVEITPEFPDSSCEGDQDVATWAPPAIRKTIVGFQVVVGQFTDSTPTFQTYVLGPDSDSQPFVAVNGENDVLVSTITNKGVSPSPFGSAELTGFGVPEAMDWNDSGPSLVSDGSSTVAFEWAGPPENSVTGGDVSADTVTITQQPGGQTVNIPASVDGVTATFSGLTDGAAYTYSDTVADGCGSSSDSDASPQFTPGVTPSVSGSPPPAVVGTPYSYALTVTGDPVPALSVTSGELAPGLGVGADGTISGTPTEPGTYDVTVTAENGVGIQFFTSGQASESFTITVDQAPPMTGASSNAAGPLGRPSSWS
jgi:hypothetical protein